MQQNRWLPPGTDFPVEDTSPFKTFLAAVFRKPALPSGGGATHQPDAGFQMENTLSREENHLRPD
jgi:hypothetical protein